MMRNLLPLNYSQLGQRWLVGILSPILWMTSIPAIDGLAQTPNGRTAFSLANRPTRPSFRLLHALKGHNSPIFGVRALEIAPDGTTLVSGGREGQIILWNLPSGQKLREWTGDPEGVESVAISRDGKTLVTGGVDRTVKVWNFPSGKLLYTISGHSAPIEKVKFSPDGKTFASGSDDGTIKLWDLPTGRLVGTLTGVLGYPSDLVFTPDRRWLIISEKGTETSRIRMWDLNSQKVTRSLATPDPGMDRMALTRDGQYLIGVGFGQLVAPHQAIHTLKLWHLATGKIVDEFPENSSSIASLAVSQDEKVMVCGTEAGTLQVWDLSRRKLLTRSSNYGQAIVSLAINANGKILAGSLTDGTIQVWELNYSDGDD